MDDILLEVLVLGGMVLVLVVGLLVVVEVVEEALVGALVVLEGDVVPELGTADVRRVVVVAAAGFRLSSSETEGWDLWLATDEVPVGFRTVLPAGGRVGGLVKPPDREVAVEADLDAEVPVALVVPGRRTLVVAEPAGRFAGAAPSGLAPWASFLAGPVGDEAPPVPVVPAVSSPDRTDSSCWTTSKPSDSDMMDTG